MELVVDYLGCQQAMCPSCPYLQICPLHGKIDRLTAEIADTARVLGCNDPGTMCLSSYAEEIMRELEQSHTDLTTERKARLEAEEQCKRLRDALAVALDAIRNHGECTSIAAWDKKLKEAVSVIEAALQAAGGES